MGDRGKRRTPARARSRRPAGRVPSATTGASPIRGSLQRASQLVCYWREGRLVFENYRTGARVAAQPITCTILDFFNRPRTAAAAVRAFPEYSAKSVSAHVRALLANTLLERADAAAAGADAFTGWDAWSPAAAFFHFSTKNVRFNPDRAGFLRMLRRRAGRTPMPPPVKRYPNAPQVELPPPRVDGEFPEVLLARRTWRRFSRRPVRLGEIATLLGLSCAIQHWVTLPGLGRVALRTFPSGGALHPLETYLLARRVEGLKPGLYHYAADTHRLQRLSSAASSRQIVSYLPTQWWFGNAAAVFLIAAVFPRTQWKYPYPRAYRAVLTEAGHLCQTICLVATWLGLAPFCSLALAERKIEEDLGIDGISESVIYAAGVGSRPGDSDWAPMPEGTRLARTAAGPIGRRRLGTA